MLPPVSEEEWPALDSWWECFTQEQPLIFRANHIKQLDGTLLDRTWVSMDGFWTAFEVDHELLFAASNVRELENTSWEEAWSTIDELWDGYADHQQNELTELRNLMASLHEKWTDGTSLFDADPLMTNWRPESQHEGPLRPSVDEEDWSQWLAHLLRSSTGPFVQALLGTPQRSPAAVRREVVFSDDHSTRRIDILVEYEDMAVSIEVKNGDTNYRKTPETARLIEQNDHRDWSHLLLLQKANRPNLEQTFEHDLQYTEEDRPTIRTPQSAPIDVRYWRDVSRLLRQMLLEEREPNSHWQASAYLFVTLIEQRILELYTFEFISPAIATDFNSSVISDFHRLVVVEPATQIDYLQSLLGENYNHE